MDLTYDILPWVIGSILYLFGALAIFWLPETSGINLPDVVGEAKTIGLKAMGDIIKSDKDPSYGRTGHSVNLDGMVVSYCSERVQEQNRIMSFQNAALKAQPAHAPIFNKNYIQRSKNTYSNPFMGINSNFPIFKPNGSTTFRSPESTLSTSSCSFYSSSSFVGVSPGTLRSSSKRSDVDVLPNPGSSSKKNATDVSLLERNSANSTESDCHKLDQNSRNDNNLTIHTTNNNPMDKNKDLLPKQREEELNNVTEESNNINKRLNALETRNENKQQIFQRALPKPSRNLNTSEGKPICQSSKDNPEPPRVISSNIKPCTPNIKENKFESRKMEVHTSQPIHTKQTKSPADLTKIQKYPGKEVASNFIPISRNQKLQSLASKCIQTNSSKSKLPILTKPSLVKNQEISKPIYTQSTLNRQNSSIEGSRPNSTLGMNNSRHKTRSFMIPRNPQMGKKVALRIERFENQLPSLQGFETNSKIPILSSSSLRRQGNLNCPIYSQSKKFKAVPPSVKEKVKHFENNDEFLSKRFAGINKTISVDTEELSKDSSRSNENSFQSVTEGENFIPAKSKMEIINREETFF